MNFRDFKEKVKGFPFFGSDVAEIFSLSPQVMRNQLTRWREQGLLLEIKRGLYALAESERQTGLSREIVAANIYQPSYISLESALSIYKLIPERVMAITSITTRKTKEFHNPTGAYVYRHLKPALYFGFVAKHDQFGFPYFIAEPEKALLDYLYLNLGKINSDGKEYFNESLRLQNRSALNKKQLSNYAQRFAIKKLNRILERLK